MADCPHQDFDAVVEVARLIDSGKFLAHVRLTCAACGERMRFVGVERAGVSFHQPAVSVDECELLAPVEPEGEKRLRESLTYEIPEIPRRH